MSTLSVPFARRLTERQLLRVRPERGVAIKRNVHELVIGAAAARFAGAFAEVLRAPGARFGAIEVKRLPGRSGADFAVGERFTGCVRLADAAADWRGPLGWILRALGGTRLGAWLEDAAMSDYAEVVELDLAPPPGRPYKVVYRYLSGSPMAGASTFLITPLATENCRFSAIFEYQELNGMAISALNRFGIALHDRVTQLQAERAAAQAGGAVLSSTIRLAALS